MAACLIFVFSALIEFAYVNVFSRVENRRRRESTREEVTVSVKENGHSKTVETEPKVINATGHCLKTINHSIH